MAAGTVVKTQKLWKSAIVALALAGCEEAKEPLTSLNYTSLPPEQRYYEIRIRNVCSNPDFRFQDIYALQSSARIENGGLMIDQDRDGLSNNHEITVGKDYNIKFNKRDTNLDGYSDLLAERGGFSLAEQQKFKRCMLLDQDTDLDGLTDCEENNLTHTDDLDADTDDDGIPDGLEVRFGMNPMVKGDTVQDLDNDTVDNYQEVKANTSATETNTAYMERLGLKYDIQNVDTGDESRECLNVQISNIPIVTVENGNQVLLYFLERDADGENRMTRAVVMFTDHEEEDHLEVEYDELEKTSN